MNYRNYPLEEKELLSTFLDHALGKTSNAFAERALGKSADREDVITYWRNELMPRKSYFGPDAMEIIRKRASEHKSEWDGSSPCDGGSTWGLSQTGDTGHALRLLLKKQKEDQLLYNSSWTSHGRLIVLCLIDITISDIWCNLRRQILNNKTTSPKSSYTSWGEGFEKVLYYNEEYSNSLTNPFRKFIENNL